MTMLHLIFALINAFLAGICTCNLFRMMVRTPGLIAVTVTAIVVNLLSAGLNAAAIIL